MRLVIGLETLSLVSTFEACVYVYSVCVCVHVYLYTCIYVCNSMIAGHLTQLYYYIQ